MIITIICYRVTSMWSVKIGKQITQKAVHLIPKNGTMINLQFPMKRCQSQASQPPTSNNRHDIIITSIDVTGTRN